MRYWLIHHYLLKIKRAPKTTGAQIYILGLGIFIILGLLFLFAAGAESSLSSYVKNQSLVPFVVLLAYVLLDLTVRILFAPSTFAQYAYYTLPIPKLSYVNQSLVLSVINLFNVAALFFGLFYLIFTTAEGEYLNSIFAWYAVLILSNNFLAFAIKRWFVFGIILAGSTVAWGFSLNFYSVLNTLIDFPVYSGIVLLFSVVICGLVTYYTADAEVYKSQPKSGFNLRFGLKIKDPLLWQELLLIIRNKRPRGLLLSFFILIPYFYFIFYDQLQVPLENKGALSFVILFLIAGLPIQYGYLGLAWESKYLELLLSITDFKDMIKSKFKLLGFLTLVAFAFSLLLTLLYIELLPILIAVTLMQLSIGNYMLLYYMIYNNKPIEINKSSFFNYQGISAAQMFLPLVILAVEFIILSLTIQLLGLVVGSVVLIILALVALHFREKALAYINDSWSRKKYVLIENYRK